MFPAAIGIAPSTVTGEEIYKIGIRIMQVLQHYSLSMRFVTSLETGASGTPLLSRSLATSSIFRANCLDQCLHPKNKKASHITKCVQGFT